MKRIDFIRLLEKNGWWLERDKGTPTTIIESVCRGDEEIAKLRMNRDIADTMWRTAMEMIQAVKLEMRIVQDAIEREYHAN